MQIFQPQAKKQIRKKGKTFTLLLIRDGMLKMLTPNHKTTSANEQKEATCGFSVSVRAYNEKKRNAFAILCKKFPLMSPKIESSTSAFYF